MLDGALYDFALTCGYAENIGNVPMEVWGSEERGKEEEEVRVLRSR